MEQVLRAAVMQTGSAMFDVERTLAKLERDVVAASKCRFCAWPCTRSEYRFIARRQRTVGPPGLLQCSTLRWKAAVLCSLRVSIYGAAMRRTTMLPSRATIRIPFSCVAAVA